LSLNLLGPFQATLDDRPLVKFRTSKVQALLIYLAVETVDTPNLAHRREALMELLWPGLPVRSAQDNLRQTLYLLRKTIPHVRAKEGGESLPFVLTDRQTARLNPACAYALDLATFRQLLDGQPTPSKLEKACALYRGEFLADFFLPDSAPFEDWAAHGRAELQRQVLDALETLTEHQITVGNYDQAQSFSWRALEIDDLRENAHRGLMTALAAAGQRTNALAQYQICQKRLGDELG
jgi:DNA-binding SARP family transcriptional activator